MSTKFVLLHDPAYDFRILQNDLRGFAKCSKLRQLNVSYEKCLVLHSNLRHKCFLKLEDAFFSTTSGVRDLDNTADPKLHCRLQSCTVDGKSLKIVDWLLRVSQHRHVDITEIA